MKVLFVGDIVGRPGRHLLRDKLKEIQSEHRIDCTIVNVENAAGGFGLTPALAKEILSYGVDVMTSGNHIFDKKEILAFFALEPRLLRPGNYPPGVPGNHQFVGDTQAGIQVGVINLQGRVFMPMTDCPFQMAEREIPKLQRQAAVIIVDFHAEATSEKAALGWFLDGKVSAIVGTHTHIPTADARILPKGTAYISDVGMTGSYDSVIGMTIESSLPRFLTGLIHRFEVATQSPRLCSVIIDIDESTGHARGIRRLDIQS